MRIGSWEGNLDREKVLLGCVQKSGVYESGKMGNFFSDVNIWLGGCSLDIFRPSFYYLDFFCQ